MNCKSAHHSSSRRRFSIGCGGFTLIELLVVAAIIIIILAVTFPAYSKLTNGNAKKQAINAVSAQAASARTLALSMQRQVGLVFYEDPNDAHQTRMALIQEIRDTDGTCKFGAIPDRPAVSLPKFVKVATLSAASKSGEVFAQHGANGAACRVLLFDQFGQALLRNSLIVLDPGGTSPRSGNAAWGLAPDAASANAYGSSVAFIIYDQTEFSDASRGLTNAEKTKWLVNTGDLIAVHPYTGAVIR